MSRRPPPGQNAPRRPPAPSAPAAEPARAAPPSRPPLQRRPAAPPAQPQRGSQPQRQTQAQRGNQSQRQAQAPRAGQRGAAARRGPPPRANDRLPLIIGGAIGGVLLLLLIVFLVTSNNGNSANNLGGVPTVANNPNDPNKQLTVSSAEAPPTTADSPPRMSLETFKALYDDPAKRPLIIDVRAAESYAAGHIKGAVSFPESDVDARVAELPKDKLVIAYCQ